MSQDHPSPYDPQKFNEIMRSLQNEYANKSSGSRSHSSPYASSSSRPKQLSGKEWVGYLALVAGLGVLLLTLAYPRAMTTIVVPALGVLAALLLVWKRQHIWACTCVAAAVGVGYLGYWFTPLPDGLSPMAAQQEATRLTRRFQAQVPNHTMGYQECAYEASKFLRKYPEYGEQIQAAQEDWAKRSVQESVAALERLSAADCVGFRRSAEVRAFLRKHFASSQDSLTQAEKAWAERSGTAAVQALQKVQLGKVHNFLAAKKRWELLQSQFPEVWQRLLAAESAWVLGSQRAAVATVQALPVGEHQPFAAKRKERLALVEQFPALTGELVSAETRWAETSIQLAAKQLTALSLRDLPGFRKLQPTRNYLKTNFQVLAETLAAAERDWVERSAAAVVVALQALKAGDAKGFRSCQHDVSDLMVLRPEVQGELRQAEQAWGTQTATAIVAETAPLLEKSPREASTRLRRTALLLVECNLRQAAESLKPKRQEALLASLDAVRRQVKELVKQDQFEQAAKLADELHQQLAEEARAVGGLYDLAQFRESCAYLAELAQAAKKGAK